MSTTTKDLGNGQWLINDNAGKAWVTNQDQLSNDTRQAESELERSHQRSTDWKATESGLQTFLDQINAGTLLPEAGTNPPAYLIEYPANNYYVSTKPELEQAISNQSANHTYMDTTMIPEQEADLATMNDALDQIATEPTGGETESLVADGLPMNIPADPADDLVITLTSAVDTEVTYVKLRVIVDHPSSPGEMLKISLLKNGEHRQMFYGDFATDEEKTFETAYFNGMFANGDWRVHLINDHTSSVNVLKECELIIYHS